MGADPHQRFVQIVDGLDEVGLAHDHVVVVGLADPDGGATCNWV
jgi:hypothetical protein